ncbi:unnamed protein product [Rhizoctonia solani]|uniref:Uncharacterized protein n=1 Tax=Rhizoctonia solani TaxID=456999 RepID=A0A8H3DZQ1_9AGAM|nr:unnamed protein product [Rhizoctonia solani]
MTHSNNLLRGPLRVSCRSLLSSSLSASYSTPAGYNGNSGYGGHSGYNGEGYSPSYSKEDPSYSNKEGGHTPIDLLAHVNKLKTDVEPLCKELEVAPTVEVATGIVAKIVLLIKAFVALCVNVKLDLSVDIKTKIAVEIVACISLIVKALAAVCIRLGVTVCIALIAQIDVCLQLLLITLNVCVDGLLAIIISLCAKLDVSVLAALKLCNLELLVKICALVKLVGSV